MEWFGSVEINLVHREAALEFQRQGLVLSIEPHRLAQPGERDVRMVWARF
jgi:hypothetical protein